MTEQQGFKSLETSVSKQSFDESTIYHAYIESESIRVYNSKPSRYQLNNCPVLTKCTECGLKFNFSLKKIDTDFRENFLQQSNGLTEEKYNSNSIYCQCSITWFLPKKIEEIYMESFTSSISLQQVQRLRIRDIRYRKTACDIADPMDLLNTGGMEISKPSWEPLKSPVVPQSIFEQTSIYHATKSSIYPLENKIFPTRQLIKRKNNQEENIDISKHKSIKMISSVEPVTLVQTSVTQ